MPTTAPLTATAARIGRNVAAELTRHQVTQGAAADEVGLSRTAFVARVAGRNGGLTATQLDALALMLGVPVEVFYDRPAVPDRQAGHMAVALGAGFVIAVGLYGLVVGLGWLIVWLAETDMLHAQAYASAGLVLLGVVLFAACAVRDRVLDARARRRRVTTFLRDVRDLDFDLRGIPR